MKKKLWNVMKDDIGIWGGTLIGFIILIIYISFYEISNNKFFLILTNLSFSYIAAVIFYIVQVKLPNKQKKERALLTFQGELSNVYDELEEIIIYIDEFWKIENDKLEIRALDGNILYYMYERNETKFKEFTNYKVYIPKHIKKLKDNIEKMKRGRLYQYLPEELIDTISELENEEFSLIVIAQNNYPFNAEYVGLQRDINRIEEYKNSIIPYVKNKNAHKIRCLTDEEIKEYKKEIGLYQQGKINLNSDEKIVCK